MTAFRKVDAERDESESLSWVFLISLLDLLAMQQELPFAERIMIHQVAMQGLVEAITSWRRFHPGAAQDHAASNFLRQTIVVGLPIVATTLY